MFLVNQILNTNKLEELLNKYCDRCPVFIWEKVTNLFKFLRFKYSQRFRFGDDIKWSDRIQYNTFSHHQHLHLSLQLHRQIGIDIWKYLNHQLPHQKEVIKNIPLDVETSVVLNYIHKLRENFYKSVVCSNISDNYHNYIDSLVKPKAGYYRHYRAKFNIFNCANVTKFINLQLQPLKLYELSDSNLYQRIVLGKKVSINWLFYSLVENSFRKETLTKNGVITWLPGFDREIDIVSSFIRSGTQKHNIPEKSNDEHSYAGIL